MFFLARQHTKPNGDVKIMKFAAPSGVGRFHGGRGGSIIQIYKKLIYFINPALCFTNPSQVPTVIATFTKSNCKTIMIHANLIVHTSL